MRTLTISFFVAVFSILAEGSVLAAGAEFRAMAHAGSRDRVDAPVSVEVRLPENLLKASAVVVSPGKTWPAQVESLGGGKARIWWIVSMAKGEKQAVTIKVGIDSDVNVPCFGWKDSSAGKVKSTDLLCGKRPVLRYMHTPFDKADIELTKKPFHHAFDPDGSRLITQGLNGNPFPHHRGIYFGYNRCKVDGQSYDIWHAHKGEHSVHVEVLKTIAGPVVGGHVVKIHWNDRAGKPFAEETRKLVAYRQSKDRSLIEFTSELRATGGPVRLDGDRQHAGVQFRASPYVAKHQKETRYLRPEKWASLPADKQINSKEHRDLPWNAVQFKIEDRAYTVAYLSDPKNPDGADFSERLYGRFGEFFPWDLTKDKPLRVRYRWWIDAAGEATRDAVQGRYEDLANPPRVELKK